ncbi:MULTISPECIES: Fe(3+)-hydroxamate ABC transporter permease FhuB [unclassified Halomonas]|uniref:Fe(3+)-hydroxamate ABC transporter permease FhuB n=1 Tax=unclassified Halomonas TaxID=2609666 RepID=UPI001C95E7A1|nr:MULTISPECIES: Fe(3+)-hydroxamate ABC transporter permease FhuB [unclassified Halomonas]MBY5924297.1 Fe(3+)-hydroxamate ABC transporter permease FhuB [Halomonas sp. DP4Y7-2]MBY6231339.1 Fe(3+)-hydroxamate ABC transporter permease FhuB [Halomonas sp. DP4Y7-1]
MTTAHCTHSPAVQRSPLGLALILAAAALFMAWLVLDTEYQALQGQWWQALMSPEGSDIQQAVLHYTFLPRLCTALVSGACLALAGCVIQQVMRNPLASPSTLGISSGAQLALVVSTIWFPGMLAGGRDIIAMLGGSAATLLVLAISWRRDLAPLVVVLAGMVVSLYISAINGAVMLFHHESLKNVLMWGAGALDQAGWHDSQQLLLRLAVAIAVAGVLAPRLALLDLEAASARSLGASLVRLRVAGLGLAILLTGSVVSAVGLIGFIGLAAPMLVKLAGARTLAQRLVWSTIVGGLLLLVTDLAVQCLAMWTAIHLPTGAVSAALGAPLLLWLLPRLHLSSGRPSPVTAGPRPSVSPRRTLWILTVLLLLAIGIALFASVEPPSLTWTLPGTTAWDDIAPWRLPRVATAASAGLILALAGTVLQRVTGNPMASPEVLGISAGVAMGVIALLLLPFHITPLSSVAGGLPGALVALTILVACTARQSFAPTRLLLTGVAISALLDSVQTIALSSGDPRIQQLLSWLSGSTYYASATSSIWLMGISLTLAALLAAFIRWLDILPLGVASASALGINITASRAILLGLVVLMTLAATLSVGPLTFIGLLAPHMARQLGFSRARDQLLAAACLGASVMVFADWIGRQLLMPYQLPAGMVAAIIGGAYFMWGLGRPHQR